MNRLRKRKTRRSYNLKSFSHQPDWWLIATVVALTIFGLLMVGNASVVDALRDFADEFYYLKLQARWMLLGFFVFVIMSLFPYQKLKKLVPYLLFFSLVSLIIVILPKFGFLRFGARRWLNIGGINFQPTELVKLSFITYLAAYLDSKKKPLPIILFSSLILILVMLQPDLGTAVIILSSGFLIYFVSGAPWWQIILSSVVGVLSGIFLIFSSSYRKARLFTFLNPLQDPLGASYHIRQILIALGSGGFLGLGLGQSRQKYEYLPAVTTDSIFAVIAEELGFLGGTVLILVFAFLIWRGFRIALRAPDRFGQLLAIGIISWLGIQTLINLSSMVALAPITGVPLPFVSYGGSSLLLVLAGSGILVNISTKTV